MTKITLTLLTLLLLILIPIPTKAQNIEAYTNKNLSITIPFIYDDQEKTLHVNSDIPQLNQLYIAKISMPCTHTSKISKLPTIQYKTDTTNTWIKTKQTKLDNLTLNYISKHNNTCTFWVNHFTTYYINSSGGDYSTLTECLIAINNTADTCAINEAGTYNINNTYNFRFNKSAIQSTTANIHINCNNSILQNYFQTNTGIEHNRKGDNFSTTNCNLNTWLNGIYIDNYNAPNHYKNGIITSSNISNSRIYISYGNINITNSYLHRGTASALTILAGKNYYINNISIQGGATYGFTNDNYQDSTFNNITISTTGNIAGIQIQGGGSQHIENTTFTNIHINTPFATAINWATGGKGHNLTFQNITILNATKGINIPDNSANNYNNIFNNISIIYTTQQGFDLHSNNQIINQSIIQTTGNTTQDLFLYTNNNPRRFASTNYNYSNGMYIFSSPASFPLITSDTTDILQYINTSQNISLCLFDLQGAGAAMASVLTTDTCAQAHTVLNGAYPGTTMDHNETNAYITNGPTTNYTNNHNASTTTVPGYSNPLIHHFTYNNQTQSSIHVFANNINITKTLFLNNLKPQYYSIKLEPPSTNNNIWLNHLTQNTIIDYGTSTNTCINNQGNFYLETLSIHPKDCGQNNISYPNTNETYFNQSNAINITWKNQSNILPITYVLYYSTDGTSYTPIGSTKDQSYTWNYTNLPGYSNFTNITLMIRPHDTNVFGTRMYKSFNIKKETSLTSYTYLLIITIITTTLLILPHSYLLAKILYTIIAFTTLIIGNISRPISLTIIFICITLVFFEIFNKLKKQTLKY